MQFKVMLVGRCATNHIRHSMYHISTLSCKLFTGRVQIVIVWNHMPLVSLVSFLLFSLPLCIMQQKCSICHQIHHRKGCLRVVHFYYIALLPHTAHHKAFKITLPNAARVTSSFLRSLGAMHGPNMSKIDRASLVLLQNAGRIIECCFQKKHCTSI